MKVLLTHGYFIKEDIKEQKIMRPYPPLGLLYISSFLDKHNIENEIFDTTFSSREILYSYLSKEQPKIIGVYVNLMTRPNVLALIDHVKANLPQSIIIIGGPEVTHHASKFLHNGADYIVVGEGEQTILELIQFIESGQNEGQKECIEGIAYLKHGEVKVNTPRRKMENLDELPHPNRNKIDLHNYLRLWKEYHGQNAISVSTMRGCPYTCKWCSRAVYGLSYRRRSPEKVVDELLQIEKEFNPDTIWFVDDVFTINYRWIRLFSKLIEDKGLRIKYECITRADRLNEEIIKLLKLSGCFRVWIGAESGSQEVIDKMDRRVKVSAVQEMINLAQVNQMEAGTFIMLGYPGETEEDIELTIDHLKKSNPDHFTITLAYPIKGTEFYEEVSNLITTELDWKISTDRDLDFKRTYHRKYYYYAIKRVVNEVRYFQSLSSSISVNVLLFKIKSMTAKAGMLLTRIIYS